MFSSGASNRRDEGQQLLSRLVCRLPGFVDASAFSNNESSRSSKASCSSLLWLCHFDCLVYGFP